MVDLLVVAAGLLPKRPLDEGAVVAVDEAGAVVPALVPPNSPPLVVAVDDGAVVAVVDAGFAPNRAPPAPVAAGMLPEAAEAAGVLLAAAPPKRPPADVPVDAGLAPNKPPAEELAPDCPPPNSPPLAGAAEVAVLAAPPPNAAPNADAEDFEESAGGAPAGVVDAREKSGLAGVAAGAPVDELPVWPLADVASADLFPKSELPELANRPEEGAADGAVVL